MKKFEYKIEQIQSDHFGIDKVENFLNIKGEEGWELVYYRVNNSTEIGQSFKTFFFKREKSI